MKKVKSTGGLFSKPLHIGVKRIVKNDFSFGGKSQTHSKKNSIFNLKVAI
jgi:hypothetical protein